MNKRPTFPNDIFLASYGYRFGGKPGAKATDTSIAE